MELVTDITIIFVCAGALGVIASYLKVPLIAAYLATGLVIGPIGFNLIPTNSISNGSATEALSTLGIAFMLFLIGLELDIKKIKKVGLSTLTIGIAQITITLVLALLFANALGFSGFSVWYIAIALVFSSTVISIKILSDTNQLASLHGRVLVGILLIQDFFAIFALIFLQGLANNGIDISGLLATLLSLTIFLAAAYLLRAYVISYVFKLFSKSSELLFIASIGWALLLTVLAYLLSFSPAIGAFIAGITLAPLSYSEEIRGRVRWLRDFFIVIFLSLIGATLVSRVTVQLIIPVLTLSAAVLLIKPLIVFILMGIQGYRRRTSFLVGTYLSQISEFSLIVAALGVTLGHIDSTTASVIVLVAIITMAISATEMYSTEKLYHFFSGRMKVFERPGHFRDDFHTYPDKDKLNDHVVLFGSNRIGYPVLNKIIKTDQQLIVVDFDPQIIEALRKQKIPSIYGDMGDPELVDHLNLTKARMVISTVRDFYDTKTILKKVKNASQKTYVFVTAETSFEALELYADKADYVILPNHLSGEYLADLVTEIKNTAPKTSFNKIKQRRDSHIKELKLFVEKNIPG